ncbi:hypothetical protein [Mycobacterium sp. C31M]
MPEPPGDAGPSHRVLPVAGARDRHAARPQPGRRVAAIIGAVAALVAAGLGAFAWTGQPPAATPTWRTDGPTAAHITVPGSELPLPVPAIHALLIRPPDFGSLGNPPGCLTSLDYPADSEVLGAQPVPDGVLLVLPGPDADTLSAVVVPTPCPGAGPAILARTVLPRP